MSAVHKYEERGTGTHGLLTSFDAKNAKQLGVYLV